MQFIYRLFLCALACTGTVLCLPVPSRDAHSLLQLQQQLLSSQQAVDSRVNTAQNQESAEQLQQLLENMSRGRLSTQQAGSIAAAGKLNNVLQRAAKSLLDKVESKSPSTDSKTTPDVGVKLHLKAPAGQQPQFYYTPPLNPVPLRRPQIIVPVRRPPPPPVSRIPSIPNVHIHPVKQVPPVEPVQETPQVHIYPRQEQKPLTPHLHIHPSSTNQKVAIKPLPPVPPISPAKHSRPVPKAPVLHIHPSPGKNAKNGGKTGYKDRKENDVQLKLNMDFKAHNRTGFQELERLVNQAEVQSEQGLARGSGYLTRTQGVGAGLLNVLQNRAAVQELSDIIAKRVLQEVEAQLLAL